MFGKILYISDNTAYIENKVSEDIGSDLLNYHVIFENKDQKILGEIVEINYDKIKINLLGEFTNGKFSNGLIRKASLNSTIRIINKDELLELIGVESKDYFKLGECGTYKGFAVCPKINDLFSSHMCIFGNSGSGKSCGVARIVQNILENKNSIAYNANFIFFDSFGEYKNAFQKINSINNNYSYKFVSSSKKEEGDYLLNLPLNLLTVDDWAILLQAEKHSQLTIIESALNYARIFASHNSEVDNLKNNIIAKALLTILYSSETASRKKDEIFEIIDICHTKEFNFDSEIPGVGYTRTFSECFMIDSKGRFGEEVLITDYILKYADMEVTRLSNSENLSFSLEEFAKALEFTLISEGFNQNKNMHDDAQIIKVRLNAIIKSNLKEIFTSEYMSVSTFITKLLTIEDKKAQIVNINLENLSDSYAKSLVKIYSRIIFDFSKGNASRATIPFHLFLEEAHRYIQKDNDTFLLGYNIFDRIAKEGRKYGVILDIISQRPVEISDTVIAQCSNFLIFKMTHPLDIKYIEEMLPNISSDVIQKMKVLQPGTCVGFGSAFKIPMIVRLDMPNPRPYSASCDVSSYWDSMARIDNDINDNTEINNSNNDVNSVNNVGANVDNISFDTIDNL